MRWPRQRLERKEYFRRGKLMNKRRLLIIIGIVAAVVVLVIVLDAILANHPPAITGLEARERVVPSASCQIACNASDRDRDVLSYNWSASGGSISGTGAAVNWTAPGSPGSYNITVTVTDGRGGEATKQRTIEVRANAAPTISTLVADADWTLPSRTIRATCTASDPDGDALAYEWTATAGHISGTGPTVNWTAPEAAAVCNITVVVKDGHGSSATSLLHISVAREQPPIIEALVVTADHCYLKTYSWGYKVGKAKEYHIECSAGNASVDLSYEWSCTGGEISGEGPMINWTAPNPAGSADVTVTVMVSDIDGNTAVKSVALNVVNCSPCTFGC
jgi:hypothetical protein